MKNIKKAVAISLAVLFILVYANFTFASTIQPKNISGGNTSAENTSEGNTLDENTSANETNTAGNEIENVNNNTANVVNNTASLRNSASNYTPINATNSAEDIPNAGIENNLNLALFILLAVVLGMFSLVQYRKIIKKDE